MTAHRLTLEKTSPMNDFAFASRRSVEQVEEGSELAPKFDADGLLPVVTTEAKSGDVLMLGYMNAEALAKTKPSFSVTDFHSSV